MNFTFGECDENEVNLTCVGHRDNEHNFITFILDLMTKNNKKIDCERDVDQLPSYCHTSGHCVGIGHFLSED